MGKVDEQFDSLVKLGALRRHYGKRHWRSLDTYVIAFRRRLASHRLTPAKSNSPMSGTAPAIYLRWRRLAYLGFLGPVKQRSAGIR